MSKKKFYCKSLCKKSKSPIDRNQPSQQQNVLINSPDSGVVQSLRFSRNPDQRNQSQHIVNIPEEVESPREKRMIVIDGSNVAYKHSVVKKKEFSVKGLSLCIDYFQKRGHDVKVVIPEFRMLKGKSTDPETIRILNSQGIVILTPNKSYDDRFVLDIAIEFDGVVISNDKFRDIINESEGNS